MTLGAYPDSKHASESIQKARELLKDNNILGAFICQGKVDPQLIKWMQDMTKNHPSHPHAMNEESKARLAEAAKHPNEQDRVRRSGAMPYGSPQRSFSYFRFDLSKQPCISLLCLSVI